MRFALLTVLMMWLAGVMAASAWAQPISPQTVDDVIQLARYGRGVVKDLAYSPDGRTLAVGSRAGVWLYDAADLNAAPRHLESAADLTRIAYSADGAMLAGIRAFTDVAIWDIASGRVLATLDTQLEAVYAVVFSPDASLLIVGGCAVRSEVVCQSGAVLFWQINRQGDVLSLERVQAIGNLRGSVFDLALSDRGNLLAVGTSEPDINLYRISEIDNPEITRTFATGLRFGSSSVDISPDGRRLSVTGSSGVLQQWSLETGALLGSKTVSGAEAGELAYSLGGQFIAVARKNGDVLLLDGSSLETLATLTGHTGWTDQVAFSPDGRQLATAVPGEEVRVWDVPNRTLIARLDIPVQYIDAVDISPDRALIAAGGNAREIWLWSAATGEVIGVLRGHTASVQDVRFSPDGRLIASVGWNGAVRLWDVRTGAALDARMPHHDGLSAVTFSPDGTLLATGGEFSDGSIRIWRLRYTAPEIGALSVELEEIQVIPVTTLINDLDFAPDNTLLAAAGQNGRIVFYDALSGSIVREIAEHTSAVRRVDFNADGTLLVSASFDKRAIVWDVATGEAIMDSKTRDNMIYSAAFSPDGRLHIVGDSMGTLGWVDVPEITDLRSMVINDPIGFSPIDSVVFDPEGAFVLAGGADGTVTIWGLPGALDDLPQPDFIGNVLEIGASVYINTSAGDILNMRDRPATDGSVLRRLNDLAHGEIIEGPTPGGDFIWWKIRLDDGLEGWVVQRVSNIDTLVRAG